MTEAGKSSPDQLYLVTLIVAGNIDIFTRHEYCENIIENLNFCSEKKNLAVYDYVLMSNRLYLIAAARKGHVSRVLRDFKTLTARQILKAVAENPEENRKEWLMRLFHFYSQRYQHSSERHFWQFGNNPVSLDSKELQQARTGLLQIPVRARLVDEPEHYIYCSAYSKQRVQLEKLSW
jgi:putative transposase